MIPLNQSKLFFLLFDPYNDTLFDKNRNFWPPAKKTGVKNDTPKPV